MCSNFAGPRLNGLLEGRPLLSVDMLGADVAALTGSISMHVPHESLCGPTLVSANGGTENIADLHITCAVDGHDNSFH